ncbi:hypothetical protein ABB02_01273 [Clostridiaceae bacterium JG1575]|nr:hypothetical protein ABB02_01273 [Clostridiaceae bacterium JG1575]
MDYFSLVVSLALIVMIALQIQKRRGLLVRAKATVVENTAMGIALGMIAVVTFFGSSTALHYAVGALLMALVVASFQKAGIAKNGLHSVNRIFMSLGWDRLRFAKLTEDPKNHTLRLNTVGGSWNNIMTFDLQQKEAVVEILRAHLKKDQLEIEGESPRNKRSTRITRS